MTTSVGGKILAVPFSGVWLFFFSFLLHRLHHYHYCLLLFVRGTILNSVECNRIASSSGQDNLITPKINCADGAVCLSQRGVFQSLYYYYTRAFNILHQRLSGLGLPKHGRDTLNGKILDKITLHWTQHTGLYIILTL
jgi:hypothetical protein